MLRRLSAVLLTIALLASSGVPSLACGDKFLRVGRSPRYRAYASVHPSTILVFAPRWTRHGIQDFEQMLKRAGHKARFVTTPTAMSQAFGAGKYDLVITTYADTGAVKKELEMLPSRPPLVPVMYKTTKADAADAAVAYRCVLDPEKMTAYQALEEIDRFIDRRLKETDIPAAGR